MERTNNTLIDKGHTMITKIISAFPGTGKSHYHIENKDTTLDSDSSEFSWIIKDGEKIRNHNFPDNYINHIKENIGKYEFIFVSSHKEVRDALINNKLYFYLVYPSLNDKDIYITRYKNRGSSESFINLISDKWNEWLYELSTEIDNVYRIQLTTNEYISDKIDEIIRDSKFNLKYINTADMYDAEYKYMSCIMNNVHNDHSIFGARGTYSNIQIVNNVLIIMKELSSKCKDINEFKSTVNKIQHELFKLNERNNSLADHDASWDR